MVSLNTQHGRSGGGISFDDRSFTAADEGAHENTSLIDTVEQPYRPIRTTGFIVIHILLTILFMAGIVFFPMCYCDVIRKSDSDCNNQTGYHIALYIHAAAYVVSLGFDRVYHHYQDLSRREGYLDFYRDTRNLRRTPLFIISLGNAILVALIEVLEKEYKNSDTSSFQPWEYLVILSGIEVFIILVALILYLVRTIKFNRKRSLPDATQEDALTTFVTPETEANEIGYRDETYKENVLEKQGDLIRYLRERNEHLSRLVLQYRQEIDFQRGIPNNNL